MITAPRAALGTAHAHATGVSPHADTHMQEAGTYWFSVKYGEDMTQLFNMDCWACTLIAHVSLPAEPLPSLPHCTPHTANDPVPSRAD